MDIPFKGLRITACGMCYQMHPGGRLSSRCTGCTACVNSFFQPMLGMRRAGVAVKQVPCFVAVITQTCLRDSSTRKRSARKMPKRAPMYALQDRTCKGQGRREYNKVLLCSAHISESICIFGVARPQDRCSHFDRRILIELPLERPGAPAYGMCSQMLFEAILHLGTMQTADGCATRCLLKPPLSEVPFKRCRTPSYGV